MTTKAKTTTKTATPGDGEVSIALAHPLNAEQSKAIGLPEEDHAVGQQVILPLATARAVINSGYAQIDPEDKAAVAQALTPGQVTTPEVDSTGDATVS